MIYNTLRPRQNGRHFADDTYKCILFDENVSIRIKISLKFVPKRPINNIPALVSIMAWRRPDDKPLSEPMMVSLPTHMCVTRTRWDIHWPTNYPPKMHSCGCSLRRILNWKCNFDHFIVRPEDYAFASNFAQQCNHISAAVSVAVIETIGTCTSFHIYGWAYIYTVWPIITMNYKYMTWRHNQDASIWSIPKELCQPIHQAVRHLPARSHEGLVAARFGFRLFQSLWNLTCTSAVCHISERNDHHNIQSRGFDTSPDLVVRRLIP